ncbi:MAG TPA: VCBS repeat-containing protein, partial [Gemmataceae bacterium]|nr:VCBS repeat-containing protein [Gemmataceae bacterium]
EDGHMKETNTRPDTKRVGPRIVVGILAGTIVAASTLIALMPGGCSRNGSGTPDTPPPANPVASKDLPQRVQQFCGACHANPPADTFPRSAWEDQVERMYLFFNQSGRPLAPPPIGEVVKYYESRAPRVLPPADIRKADHPLPLRLERTDYPIFDGAPDTAPPHISNVNLVHLFDPKRLDVLACEMKGGAVLVLQPYLPKPTWRLLYSTGAEKGFNPAHTEVVDLDGDGIKDILVADLGNFFPTDDLCGRVVWLRGKPDGTYTPITLLANVGRVADVRAGDFFGHGKMDLIVAVFGWRYQGAIVLLENQTTDWNHPRFVPHVLDERSGAIHVPVCDLNGDGRPDFVALISQEHETVVAFLNEGGGHFRKETIYTAPHPAYGSTGIELVDLDGDGKLDVLYTNGDVFDDTTLKPYHGVHWLRNRGTFPFEHHLLTSMYGVHRAIAADFQGNGRKDIIAVSMLPPRLFPMRAEKKFDALVYLEQVKPGEFVRHSLEQVHCDHVSCAAGAWDGDGKIHFVTGNFTLFANDGIPAGVTLWQNVGPAHPKKLTGARQAGDPS